MTPRLLRILPVVLLLSHSLSALAAAPAEQRLRKAVDETIAIAEQSSTNAALIKKVRPVLERNMSFAAMTRRAIGPGWRQFSPDEQKKAVDLFTELVIRRYGGRFTIGERPQVTYKAATTPAPGRTEIPTTLLYKGSHYEVIYRLEQAEDWKITDVVVEGVSFVANYRSQFDSHFQKGGPSAVLNALAKAVENPK